MALGSTCILYKNNFLKLKPKKVEINGVQKGIILCFEIKQTFQNDAVDKVDISYIFPNDLKMCIYDTTFVIGDKIIKPKLVERNEAQKIYDCANEQGISAIYGANIAGGLSEFKIGNLPSGAECEVIIKMALKGILIDKNKFLIKFPLDVYTPSGSIDCLNIKSNFSMKIQAEKEVINNITSNVTNYEFDKENKIFTIINKKKNKFMQNSIIITFETIENIKSSIMIAPEIQDNKYEYSAVTIVPDLNENKNDKFGEFIFLIDCSGSMDGYPIKNACECLEIFIHSLPKNSYFNIVRFGGFFEKLFDDSRKYDEGSAQEALKLVHEIKANFGGTDIYRPLYDIFQKRSKSGIRHIFILTDGEVDDPMQVIQLVSKNSHDNQCFTIGLGDGCDAGLIEKIAEVSSGRSDFIQDSKSISERVIPQLKASLHENLKNIIISTEGDESNSFEISPYPIPSICYGSCQMVFLRSSKDNKSKNTFGEGMLINGDIGKETIEIPINNIINLSNNLDDLNIFNAIISLFAYETIKKIEQNHSITNNQFKLIVNLSISSGVLCEYTGYIGMIEQSDEAKQKEQRAEDLSGVLFEEEPPYEYFHPFIDQFAFDDYSEYDNEYDQISDKNKSDENNNNDTEFDMLTMIRCQNIDGFWEDLNEVNRIIGINIDHIDKIKLNDLNLEKKCVATILAISSLNVLSPNKIGVWKLIEEKAISWLKENIKDIDIDYILNETKKLIPK